MNGTNRNALIERKPARSRIEYRTKKMEFDADLGQFAAEGWELVAVLAVPLDPSMAMFYFRRSN